MPETERRPHPQFPELLVGKDGTVVGPRGWELSISTTGSGHARISRKIEGRTVDHMIGRLVLQTWVGPAPEGLRAEHRNGDLLDNRLENLRWGLAGRGPRRRS